MENKQNIITISAYILLTVLFFTVGYFFGRISTAKNYTQAPKAPYAHSASTPALVPDTEFYRLKMTDNNLILYKITPNSQEEVYKIQIIEDIFPPEDIYELQNGITFSNIYDAHSFIENFVS